MGDFIKGVFTVVGAVASVLLGGGGGNDSSPVCPFCRQPTYPHVTCHRAGCWHGGLNKPAGW